MQSSSDAKWNPAPLLRSLAVNVALPLVAVQVLTHAGWSAVAALAVAAVFPLGSTVFALVRRGRVDPVGALVLVSLLVGIALALFTGDARFALGQGTLVTALFGVACLASLATPQPLIFRFAREYSSADPAASAAAAATWDARWAIPRVRAAFVSLTLIWGVAFVVEAVLRTAVVVLLPSSTAAVLSYALDLLVFGGLIAFTLVRARRGQAALAAAGR
jgi:hypothetical protein